jgi:hypothetical protein
MEESEQLELPFETTSPTDKGGVDLLSEAESGIDSDQSDPGSVALSDHIKAEQISWQLALQKYDVVSVDGELGYVVMAEKRPNQAFPLAETGSISIAELGSASPSPWTSWTREEHVPQLRDRQGLTQYFRMKRNDGIVRGSLRALKTPLLSAHWYIKPPMTPRGSRRSNAQQDLDKKIADFCHRNIFHELNVSFPVLLHDILLCCEYGYMPFEIVFNPPVLEGHRFVQKIRKIAPRHPMDVQEWRYDKNGGPDGIVMESNITTPTEPGVFIPIDKLAIFTPEPEAGDLSGVSVLRSAYKHWFYKETLYKIDAIQKERHGIGIPVIKLPIGYSPEDKNLAEDLGRNLRTNERAHVVLPPGWELIFAKVEGQMVDCMKSIEHHDMAIMANVLGSWMKEPNAQEDSLDMFMKSTRYVAMVVADIFNRFILKKLVYANFKLSSGQLCPELVCRRLGEWQDLRTQSFTIRNLVGAGVIEPDDGLEEELREELDMPPKDYGTARKMITDPASLQPEDDETDEMQPEAQRQRGARAGRPRQQPVPPSGSGRSNAGIDRSGER